MKKSKGIAQIFIITLLLILVMVAAYTLRLTPFKYLNSNMKQDKEQSKRFPGDSTTEVQEFIEEARFEDLSDDDEIAVRATKHTNVTIRDLDEIRNYYMEKYDLGDCPGICRKLVEEGVLESQFALLKEIASMETCTPSDELKESMDQFILFTTGTGARKYTDLVRNDSLGLCGIKILSSDGYDAWLGNFEYKAGFLDENRLIQFTYPLFPYGEFDSIDALWNSFGYDGKSCNAECYEKQLEYMTEMDYSDPEVAEVIDYYDSVVSEYIPE
jgi:hypothetical protein